MMRDFEAIVIGSGFGGSVMTYRLAEAGMHVCLLERGKAYPPNSFPRTPDKMAKNFWDPSKGLYGLFNVWSFKGSGALVSSGLGGGSLIYANVLKRKDEKWFKEDLPDGSYKPWVVQYKQLERHYEDVEMMMNAQKYPLAHKAYENTYKTLAMREAAAKIKETDLKSDWELLNLAVSFRSKNIAEFGEDDEKNPPIIGAEIEERFKNIHSIENGYKMPRSTCRLCGECDIGCNYGSKNTLDFNYISAAVNLKKSPAEVKTLCEVTSFKPLTDGGFQVNYRIHEPEKYVESSGKVFEEKTLTCKYLILAAGTFGTQYIFAKSIGENKSAFPSISRQLGRSYSVNGDLLSFVIKSIERKNGKNSPRELDPAFGPVITSALRFGDDLDEYGEVGRGFYIEDGGHPVLMSWASEISGIGGYLKRTIKFLKIILKYRFGLWNDADLGAEISDLIGDATTALSSLPMLSMGRDFASGNLNMNGKRLECDWTIKDSKAYYDRVRRAGKAIAKSLNAEFMDNPSYRWNFHQILTAHPIGGCAMGENKSEAVIDACGEVFDCRGLFVADGSVMPGPVGPNPSLTIAALSNRFAEHIIADHKGESHECKNGK